MFSSVQVVFLAFFLLHEVKSEDNDIISHLIREKCYDELGCFSANSPFFDIIERPLSLLPDEREEINTKFYLFTPRNPSASQNFTNLHFNETDILKSNFDPKLDTKFVVPGYISSTAPQWKMPLIKALLADHNCNVFLVDWSGGDGPVYEQAVANTRIVGAEIALFIDHLEDIFPEVRPENMHLIGHSLGAHISGYAGKRLKKLGRITAMDPAGPYFTNVKPIVRLDRDDALLVDAIHTNVAATRFQGFGLTESIGHFDFYPNGGHLQPGCPDMGHAILDFLKHPKFDAEGLREISCNHLRAIELVISSIRNKECRLIGALCDSWDDYVAGKCGTCKNGHEGPCVALGAHADQYKSMMKPSQSLNFYLNTTATEPYCIQ